MYEKSLFALALALTPFTSAFAGDVTHHAEARFAVGEKGIGLAVPMPETNLGLPTSVKVELVLGIRGSVGIENVSKEKGETVLFTDYGVDVSAANGALHLAANDQFALFETLAAADGTIDFAGESGETLITERDTDTRSALLSGKSLERFLKNSKSHFLQFTATGGASSNLLGVDRFELEPRQELVVMLDVTYVYASSPGGGALVANADSLIGALPAHEGSSPLVARPVSTRLAVA